MDEIDKHIEKEEKFLEFQIEKVSNSFFEVGKSNNAKITLCVIFSCLSIVASLSAATQDASLSLKLGIGSFELDDKVSAFIFCIVASVIFLMRCIGIRIERIMQDKLRLLLKARYDRDAWHWYLHYPKLENATLILGKSPTGIISGIGINYLVVQGMIPLSAIIGKNVFGLELCIICLIPYAIGITVMVFGGHSSEQEIEEAIRKVDSGHGRFSTRNLKGIIRP